MLCSLVRPGCRRSRPELKPHACDAAKRSSDSFGSPETLEEETPGSCVHALPGMDPAALHARPGFRAILLGVASGPLRSIRGPQGSVEGERRFQSFCRAAWGDTATVEIGRAHV